PDGEFVHLIVGAVMGAILNIGMNYDNIANSDHKVGKGFAFLGIGMLSGALSAGMASGMTGATAAISTTATTTTAAGNAAAEVIGFGAGFIGNFTDATVKMSFLHGALAGMVSGATGGLISGVGNGLLMGYRGSELAKYIGTGMGVGTLSSGLIGGLIGGIDAARSGRSFWDGSTSTTEVLADAGLPYVPQEGENNCGPSCGASASRGELTQEQLRAAIGGDPETTPVRGDKLWEKWAEMTGRGQKLLPNNNLGGTQELIKQQHDFALSLQSSDPTGHSVLLNRVSLKTTTSIRGKVTTKLLYHVMDPARGQYIKLAPSTVKNVFQLFPKK
ncbi:MAG: hypothetical protein PUB21_07800, partial [Bacteroidales bacterium]|nr:hypothetical protein [Bacteroidales bacterium]